jgi:hypothetical protein
MIIGTPSEREASSMCSRSWTCQARGLVEVSVPSGIGPDVVAARIGRDDVRSRLDARPEAFEADRRKSQVASSGR